MNARLLRPFGAAMLALSLGSPALAGGSVMFTPQNVSARETLSLLTGVKVVERPPYDGAAVLTPLQLKARQKYFETRRHSYAVTVNVRGRLERVMVTPFMSETSRTVNGVRVNLNHDSASPAQREALLRVALGFFNVCWPAEVQSSSAPFWRERLTQPWETRPGWQEQQVGVLKVGWSGKDGFSDRQDGAAVAGLTLEWPDDAGRCTF